MGIAGLIAFFTAPTFSRDVAPIFYARCVSCHREGCVALFPPRAARRAAA
jgi:hypothetical protein